MNEPGGAWEGLSYSDTNNDGAITPATEIIEESNYYPFGLKHKGYNNVVSSNGNSTAQKFGFTGKEHQDELGLGWIDITARNYDAALGRWMNLDPLAEMMRRHSPYNYAFNNPIYFTDPDGMMPCPSNCGDDEGKISEVELDRRHEEKVRFNNEVQADAKKFFDWLQSDAPEDRIAVLIYKMKKKAKEPYKPDFSGVKGRLYRLWTGGNINGIHYDFDGNPDGLAPIGGLGLLGYVSGGGAFKISKVAPDWGTKGAHVHFGKIELAIRPGANGSIVVKPVFASQVNSATKLKEFNRIGKSFLKLLNKNPRLRQELIQKSTQARDALKIGNKFERAKAGELNFLIKALKN